MNHIAEHNVNPDEAEEVFALPHHLMKARDGRYAILGRSGLGRCLSLIFEYKGDGLARIVTGRDMTAVEKKLFRRKT